MTNLNQSAAPDEFYCRFTGQIMENPVTDPYGNTYEEWAILKALEKRNESPINRRPLKKEDLKPNIELKQRIVAWREQNETKKI
jgi:hypothetical protein